jgi:hypothetical protein
MACGETSIAARMRQRGASVIAHRPIRMGKLGKKCWILHWNLLRVHRHRDARPADVDIDGALVGQPP